MTLTKGYVEYTITIKNENDTAIYKDDSHEGLNLAITNDQLALKVNDCLKKFGWDIDSELPDITIKARMAWLH